MDYPNCTTEHRKNKHLKLAQRVIIQTRLKDGYSPYKIAKELGCAANTVRNEIMRGSVEQIIQGKKVIVYFADAGQHQYQQHRKQCHGKYKRFLCKEFVNYVGVKMLTDNWSVDSCFGEALLHRLFESSEMVCMKTLYSYIDLGLMPLNNMDLPLKLRRSTKQARARKNKKNLGRSIEERPESISSRKEFGHWEIDTVIGTKTKDDEVLLTLAERQTRCFIVRKIKGKTAPSVMAAISLLQKEYGTQFDKVFKTITSDNGSEFADLAKLEAKTQTKIYFTHPYTSCERETNERHNGLIRRFIPKGNRMDGYSSDEIGFIEDWCNCLPRRILNYHTPEELFEQHLDAIYAA